MIRHEGKDITVRYDGTETLVDIHRYAKGGGGLTTDELKDLIDVLVDARDMRRRFDASAKRKPRLVKRRR